MSIWEVAAKVGGIHNVFKILFAYFLSKYSLINFKIDIINQFFYGNSEESVLKYDNEDNIIFSTWDKFQLMLNLRPDRRLLRFISRGEKKLKKEFDYVKIIKDIKKLQQHHK
jgi:hypothetical protein